MKDTALPLLLILCLFFLFACEPDPKEYLDRKYKEEKSCGSIASFLKKTKWQYKKENDDWLCIISRDGTSKFGSQIVFYQNELNTVLRFIYVQTKASGDAK